MTATTSTLAALTDRLATLRELEQQAHQRVLATKPYSVAHLQAHGNWSLAYGRYHELKETINIYLKED